MVTKVTITTGYTCDGNGAPVRMTDDLAHEHIDRVCAEAHFPGWTIVPGHGAWTNDNGAIISEPVFVLTAFVPSDMAVGSAHGVVCGVFIAAARIARALSQTYVLVTVGDAAMMIDGSACAEPI